MAENKKSFIGYCDWENTFEMLTDDEAGKLIKHFFNYINDKDPQLDDRLLTMAFEPIKLQLKRDLQKYKEVKKKRSEAGRNGGLKSGETRSKTNQDEANEANASFVKQTEANEAVTVNDTVIVIDTDNDILLEKETKEIEVLISETEPNNFPIQEASKKVAQKKVSFQPPDPEDVQKYCEERQNGISGQYFCDFYASKGWKVGNQKMIDWKAAVRTWEQKNKTNGTTNNANNGFNPNKNGNGKVSGSANIIAGIDYQEFA